MAMTVPDSSPTAASGQSRRSESLAVPRPTIGDEVSLFEGMVAAGRHLGSRTVSARDDLTRAAGAARSFHRHLGLGDVHDFACASLASHVVALTRKGSLPYKPRDFGRGGPGDSGGFGQEARARAPPEQSTGSGQRPAENHP